VRVSAGQARTRGGRRLNCDRRVRTQPPWRVDLRWRDAGPPSDKLDLLPDVSLTALARALEMGPCKPHPESISKVLGGPEISAVISSRVIEIEWCYGRLTTWGPARHEPIH